MAKISIQQLKEITEMAKQLKSNVIYVTPNAIYGTDTTFTILRVLGIQYHNLPMNAFVYIENDMNSFMKLNLGLIEEVEMTETYVKGIDTLTINNQFEKYSICNLITSLNDLVYTNIVSPCRNEIIDDMYSIPMFETAINLKANEGMKMLSVLDEFDMPMYKGLLPLAKADKVSLQITDFNHTFLCNFIIHKMKGKKHLSTINQYMRCIKM